MQVARHWLVAIFELLVPFLNLCDASGIVTKSLLNLPNGSCLGTIKLLGKFNAISQLRLFHHFMESENPASGEYTPSLTGGLLATDTLCGWEIIACA